jgi:hypothetical protein
MGNRADRTARSSSWLLACGALLAGASGAQDEDLKLPPRIDGTPLEARFEPPPPSRRPAIDEVIVVGQNPWRLPDLGSSWRLGEAEKVEPARIEVHFFPLYDPENPVTFYASDDWSVTPEIRRVGFIELFRVRFGDRDRDRDR